MAVKLKSEEIAGGAKVIKKASDNKNSDDAYLLKANIFVCAVIGFLLSGVNIGGGGSPYVIAFMAALSPIQSVAAAVGMIGLIFLKGGVSLYITEITAALAIIALKYTFGLNKRQSGIWVSLYAGGVYLTCGLVAAIFFSPSFTLFLVILLRASLCFILSYFIFEFLTEFGKNNKFYTMGEKSVSTAIVYVLAVCALSTISFGYFNLGRAFCAFAILTLSLRQKTSGGALVGGLSAMGLMLTSYDLGKSSVILICSGLLAGAFSNCTKLSVSVIFIAANFISTIIIGLPAGSANYLFDITIAAVAFALIPDIFHAKFISNDRFKTIAVNNNCEYMSKALHEVKDTVSKAATALGDKKSGSSNIHVKSSLEYLSIFENVFSLIKQADNCVIDSAKAETIEKVFKSNGFKNTNVCVFYNDTGHIFIECCYDKKIISQTNITNIIKKISDITDKELDTPHITYLEKTARLRLHEIPPFTADIGVCEKSGFSENITDEISGDTQNYFTDGLGKMFFILSDGMGMGARAAVESRMTVSLLTSLLKAGFEPSLAVRLTSQLMTEKSADEIFSTVDLLALNLFSGKADIIKAGAAATLLKSNGFVKTLESSTLPSGIITPADFEKKTVSLKDGDCLVMISDGINEYCFPKIKELMLSQGLNAQYTADEIMKYAVENEISKSDDKTVIAIRINC